MRRTRLAALPLAAAALILAGGAVHADPTAQWTTYHLTPDRGGDDNGEPSFRNLGPLWATAALDGAVDAEPLVYRNDVIVATENNSVYAFDIDTGVQRWKTTLASPRTKAFSCQAILPLGIMGTPVIDGGSLYVVAEEEVAGADSFHMAKIDPSDGSVAYDTDITPDGMDVDPEKERSALAVSGGNVVVTWGSLAADCGPYHGYLETVRETDGAKQSQWHDTAETGGTQGGIWAPSGPAVDPQGNIYVSTGNGSSTSVDTYDYGDSVLEFPPAFNSATQPAFFAPGTPEAWYADNADDEDLGSVGPTLLPNSELFAIGKGGYGYLLTQNALPGNDNPGGGQAYQAQVCRSTIEDAYGGTAVMGDVVFVPCFDGMTAVSIDSPTSFHVLWRSSGRTSGPPIVAGGLVWSTAANGTSSTLFGLDPGSGAILDQLSLPMAPGVVHFATAAAADGTLLMAADDELTAFAPPPVSAAPELGGYEVDGWGALHPYGGASIASIYAYWPGRDEARGIVMRPDRKGGYVLDASGGVNPFGTAVPVDGAPSWPGADVARGIVLDPCDSSGAGGYVLDDWGGIHAFGGAPPVSGGGYWSGRDLARGIAVNPCSGNVVSGYTLDGWGGIHPFWQTGSPALPKPYSPSYWPGQDVTRGLVLTSSGSGYILDDYGALHVFGSASATSESAYFPGQDVARAVTLDTWAHAAYQGGYVLTAYGQLAPWWVKGTPQVPSPSGQPRWSYKIARGAAA